jgi:predicted aspartyl protease
MSASYNTSYFPPIPILQIMLGRRGERPSLGPLEAILDTGADATIIPEAIAEQINAVPLDAGQLVSQWGEAHPVNIYVLEIEIEGVRLPGVVVAGDAQANEIILGRNVLNKLPLFFDGPAEQTEMLDDATVRRLRARRKT